MLEAAVHTTTRAGTGGRADHVTLSRWTRQHRALQMPLDVHDDAGCSMSERARCAEGVACQYRAHTRGDSAGGAGVGAEHTSGKSANVLGAGIRTAWMIPWEPQEARVRSCSASACAGTYRNVAENRQQDVDCMSATPLQKKYLLQKSSLQPTSRNTPSGGRMIARMNLKMSEPLRTTASANAADTTRVALTSEACLAFDGKTLGAGERRSLGGCAHDVSAT